MGKLRIILFSADNSQGAECMAYVFKNNDQCVGNITTKTPLECTIDKDSRFSFCINGSFSEEVMVSANGDYNIVVEYCYIGDFIQKIGIYDSKTGEEKGVGSGTDRSHSYQKNTVSANQRQNAVKSDTVGKTMFEKLKKHGGWINGVFWFIECLLALGTVIAFFVLTSDNLPGLGVIVLFGGAFVCFMFYLEYILAGYFYFAARDKGYTDLMYLFFPWVFPVIGHLLIVALPDRGGSKNHERH